ncbi:putative protein isoform X1 [Capsicum annuum]
MRQALLVKNKLGFVNGTCVKSSYKGELLAQWKRCNAVVLSRISSTVAPNLFTSIVYALNARRVWEDFKERFEKSNLTRVYQLWNEVVGIRQGTDSVIEYYLKLCDLWDELDVLVPSPGCNCAEDKPYIEHLQQQRLLIFLMGLNETFSHVRSDIHLKLKTPSVNQAYSIVVQEESQRLLGVVRSTKEPFTMLAGKGNTFKDEKKPQSGEACEICGYRNHVTADCYRLVGFPPDFRSKKKFPMSRSPHIPAYPNGVNNSRTGNYNHVGPSSFRSYANNATTTNKGEQELHELTINDIEQVHTLKHNKNANDFKANLAGNVSLNNDCGI